MHQFLRLSETRIAYGGHVLPDLEEMGMFTE